MTERTQPAESLPKDPIRIVYHAENRTFARLFNERSLDEVKDVVRRKLGLGRDTDVSLKQMSSDGLLDLDDDDDFQAFRVLLRSCNSIDIRVTVGRSQGFVIQPLLRQLLSTTEPTTTSSASPSKSPGPPSAAGQSGVQPEAPRATQTLATPSTGKRMVSFEDAAVVAPGRLRGGRAPRKQLAVAPTKTTRTLTLPESVGTEEPPKKKQKKEATKAKDPQSTEVVQSIPTKASDVSKLKKKKSAALDRETEAETSTLVGAVTVEPPAKKPGKEMDDGAAPKKSSAPVDRGGMDQPVNQSADPVNEASLQSASDKPTRKSAESGVSKTRKSEKAKEPKVGACAAIPKTSASTTVESEVAAAILSGYLSRPTETIPPEPPAKRKYIKKGTKESSASSRALPVEATSLLIAPAHEVPSVPTERGLEHVVPTNGPPQQTLELHGPPCPICLEEPFHIRYCCPTVLKGPDAIRARLEGLKGTNTGDQQSLIKELEGLLRDSIVTSKPSPIVQSHEVSPPPSASPPRTPIIPSNSYVSEVTVEGRDEGSSSESFDDMSEGGVEDKDKEVPAPRRQQTPNEPPLPANDDLNAVIRGPASKRPSILHFIDRIVGDEDDKDSESEEDEAELEEDPDEEVDRSRRRLSRNSSDSESEDEASRSPSSSRSAEGISSNSGQGIQGFNEPAEGSAPHQDSDVVMKEPVDPPVLGGRDDECSEETHVGSEGRMDVDHESTGEKGAAAIVELQPSSPAPRNEPQGTDVDLASNRDRGVPVASVATDEIEIDPIEPADDLEPPTNLRSDADPIETTSEVTGSLFTCVAESTPKPGVTERIKTRGGQILNDDAERPVLLEQLTSVATDEVTPLSTKGKSRKKNPETSTSQEPAPARRSPRFSSLPPATSTPVAVVLMNHRSKAGARVGKAAKTPAKRSEERSGASQSSIKSDAAKDNGRLAPTPSLVRWETLTEPSSPSLQVEETSVRIDELMSSSPLRDDIPIRERLNDKERQGQSLEDASSHQAESSQSKERLFDLSSSQIPFPYSQYQDSSAPTASANGKEREKATYSDSEPEVPKRKPKPIVRYRSLSQLASQATLFSPSLPTPSNKSLTNGKTKKRVADEGSSSSSSSSDADEAHGSGHIPRERRAGSVLETKKKKSRLSRF